MVILDMPRRSRPVGVTILAILAFLEGLVSFFGGLAIMGLASIAILFPFKGPIMSLLGGGFFLIGGLLAIVGLIWFGIGMGLWNGKNWARIIAIILSILYLIGGLLSLSVPPLWGEAVFSIILSLIIIYYLTRSYVKDFFSS